MIEFTSADYTRALDSHEGRQGGFVGYQGVVGAALRIAISVAEPGRLEAIIREAFDRRNAGSGNPAAAIRKSLMEVDHG